MVLLALVMMGCVDPPESDGPEVGPPGEGPDAGKAQGKAPGKAQGKAPGRAPGGGQGGPGQQGGFHATPDFSLVGTADDAPRDLLLISLDTVRADRLGVYGGRAETPNLAGFSAQGARFDQAISHFPETALSHWAMMSGVLPEVHGNVPAHGGSLYPGPTLAELAKEHGYQTAAVIGGITMTDSASGMSRGFDVYDDEFEVDPADMRRHGDEVTTEALAWWAQAESPKFLFVHYFDAHFPYTPAAPWDTRYDADYTGTLTGTDADLGPIRDGTAEISARDLAHVLALYDGELSELDAMIAPLLDATAGSETVVAITSDHGESFEHDYLFNHRAGLWDGITRVPLLVRGPGVEPGTVVGDQVGLTDITPTLLELVGLPSDSRMQGQSRVPLMRGEGGGQDVVYSVTDPWADRPQFAARTVAAKVIERGDEVLSYGLSVDPSETDSSAPVAATLAGARATYDAQVADLAPAQVAPANDRSLSPGEAAQLEALGYVVPEGTTSTSDSPVEEGKAGKPKGLPPGTTPPKRH